MRKLTGAEMAVPSRTGPPSYRQCRAATRSVLASEYARDVVNTVRPRSALGVFRSRGPLPLLLYIAGRDGRLVWRGVDSFALLQPPAATHRLPGGIRMGLARLVGRHWDMLLFTVPPVLMLLGAVLFLLAWDLAGPLMAGVGAMLLVLFVAIYVSLLMVCLMLNILGMILRQLFWRQPADDVVAAELLPNRTWTMTLCHHCGHGPPEMLLRDVAQHLDRLIRVDVRWTVIQMGADATDVRVTETLICLRRGASTERTRKAVAQWSGQLRTLDLGTELTFRVSVHRSRERALPIFEAGGFFFWYYAAVAVLLEAEFVADWERTACAGTECAGRPVTYQLALRWLSQRLLFTDPFGLSPGTERAWYIGWMTSLMSLMGIFVAATAAWQYRTYRNDQLQSILRRLETVAEKSRVLIMVATAVERDAVLQAARKATKEEPGQLLLPHHTVLNLGTVSNATLMLVQSEPGSVSPGAASITAASVISRLDLDYLILTGICYGLRPRERGKEQELTDILVATQLRAIDHRKVTEESPDEAPSVLIRSDYVSPSTTLRNRFRMAEVGWHGAPVHYGPMLSSSVLVNSRQLHDELLRQQPDAYGGEMEGSGVYAAAAPGKVDWIVVKGICDWGYDKTDRWQEQAARNAAEFVIHTIARGSLDERPGR